MRTSYPPWERVLAGLRLADTSPTVIRTRPAIAGAGTGSILGRWQAHADWSDLPPVRPPSDLTIVGYEDLGFPILSWEWSPDDRLCHGGSYGLRYRQLMPGAYGIVVPAPVWVGSSGQAHRTIWDVYGCCIFGGTYEVAVSFVPPDRPASAWSEPIELQIPEAF
jgi:hypothetical protein